MVDVRKVFEGRFQQYGHDPRTLDWSPESQRIRFRVLCEVTDISAKRVADLGCGLGDFWTYIGGRFTGVQYTGYDFSQIFVEECRRTHGGARFELLDVLREEIPERFDVVVSSGLHNLEVGTNEEDTIRLLERAWTASDEAVAVNMLSDRAAVKTEGRHYYAARKMLQAASKISPYVALRQDYLPHDFTIYLYHNPRPRRRLRTDAGPMEP